MSTILIVDDIMVVDLCCFVLASIDGTRALRASNEFEAIELARSYRFEIDLLLSDVNLATGRLRGLELAECVCQTRPPVNVLLMSAFIDDEALLRPEWQFISKPCRPCTLVEKVQLALDRPSEVVKGT